MEKEIITSSRILVVDDQEANLLLLERLLQQAGYKQYRCLQDSRQLLDQFRIFQPDLIVLDLMMPRLDGYAVMKQLTGWQPSGSYLPILVVTADVSRTARQKALALGAKDFLTKPIDTAEATLRIYNLLLTRWLYRHMELSQQRCVDQAGESKKRIENALLELERISGTGPLPIENLTPLRTELRHALQSMTMLAGESVSAPAELVAGTAGAD